MRTSIFSNIEQLVKQRDFHSNVLAEIDQRLSAIRALIGGAAAAPRRSGRPGRKAASRKSTAGEKAANGSPPVTLADHLEAVIKQARKPVAISDLLSGIGEAGYKSKSKNLRQVVTLALIKDERFKRSGRGIYRLK